MNRHNTITTVSVSVFQYQKSVLRIISHTVFYICLQKRVHFANLPRPRPSAMRNKHAFIVLHSTTDSHDASLCRSEVKPQSHCLTFTSYTSYRLIIMSDMWLMLWGSVWVTGRGRLVKADVNVSILLSTQYFT